MYQFIFNLSLRLASSGLPYKILVKLKDVFSKLSPNKTIQFTYKRFMIEMPFTHDYPINLKKYPTYSENLGEVAKVVFSKYPGASAIDVGANIGDSAIILQSFVSAPILCIEGNPKFIPLLKRNILQLKDITVEECFVGEENETVVAVNYGGTARIEKSLNGGIEVRTVQQILANNELFKQAKLLKIDTDGFDNKIIRASKILLEEAKPVVFFEYDPFFLAKQQEDPTAIFSILHSLGYNRLLLFDNLGHFVCEVSSNNALMLKELTAYYDDNGQSYLDICAIHTIDEDLIPKIKQAFIF